MSENAFDLLAEQSLLGAALTGSDAAITEFLTLPPQAYFVVKHQVLASIITDMIAKRIPVDPTTLLAQVMDQGVLGKIGGAPYIHTLVAACPTPANAGFYAEWLAELYGRRMLWQVCVSEAQRLDALWNCGERTGTADSVARIRVELESVQGYAAGSRQEHVLDLATFLEQVTEYEWLVPGLLERRDRMMITGDEGGGKSMLMAQFACTLAAGLHPFTSAPLRDNVQGIRVAILDCENSPAQSRRRYREVVRRVDLARETHGLERADWAKQLTLEFRTDGIDLMAAHEVAWLERYVSAAQPDVLIIGPLYKLHHEDMNSEPAARSLINVLDQIRARYNCAILTEAHAGHSTDERGNRKMRPRGSALFLGWPEFGFGIRKAKDDPHGEGLVDFVSWRGQREQRAFPEHLIRGHSVLLPWRPTQDYYDVPDPDWNGFA